MKKLALIIAACVLAACSNASADDPAILVCEEIAKLRLLAPATYARISSVTSGSQALLMFDSSNAAGVPIRDTFSCDFDLDPTDGKFHLSTDGSQKEIEEKAAAIEARKRKAGSIATYEERHAALVAIEQEYRTLLADGLATLSIAMSNESVASGLPFYPIDPAATQLRVVSD